MIKISRNFCRFSALLSYYEYYIKRVSKNDIILTNNFYLHLTNVIKNTFTILYFIDFLKKVVEENKEYEICNLHKPGFEIFESEIYKKILSTYNIFSDKNFELTPDIINTFKSYLYRTESIKNLFYDLLKNENMIDVLDIDLLFYSKYQENITSQIIDSVNNSTNESLTSLIDVEKIYKKNNEFCENILTELVKNVDNIKKEISFISQKWTESRIHLIEKIIIGLAISEFKIYKTPIQVIINEYMNISKEFCGEKSNIFINGLLDPMLKKIQTV